MRIVKIKGGLGNQLFQYSFVLLLRQKTGDIVKLDMQTYKNLIDDPIRQARLLKFNTDIDIATEEEIQHICLLKHTGSMLSKSYKLGIAIESIFNRRYYFEKDRRHRDICNLLTYKYYDGYWQSWKNIDDIWDELRTHLIPRNELHPSTKKMIKKVSEENSVFVGVRRGDYQDEVNHFGSFGQKYYTRAVAEIKKKIPNPVLYVFSNDIPWVKKNLSFDDCVVNYREPDDVVDDFEDLMIMAACKHAIIINSTYHWWGARINDYEGKIVVAPEQWFFDKKPIDIVPPRWMKI